MSDKSSPLAVWHSVDSCTNGSKALRGAAPSGHTSEQVTVSDSKMLSAESHEPGKGVVAPVPANSEAYSPLGHQSILSLAYIIKLAWGDPGNITGAVWDAGYRKSEKTAVEAARLTMDLISEYHMNDVPCDHWPTTYDQVLSGELNRIVFEAEWPEDSSPYKVAKAIISDGYRKGVTNV